MANNFGVKKNDSTRDYLGGELIYFNSKQVKQIWVKKNSNTKMVWQYDITAPTLYCNQATGAVYYRNSASFAITGTVSDTESGVKSVTVDGTAVNFSSGSWTRTVTLTTGAQTHTVEATDNAGNVSRVYVKTYLDTTAPSVTYSPTSDPCWSYDNVTVTASASDGQSGLKSLTIGGQSTGSRTYTPTTTKQSIPIIATDNAGNTTTKYAYIQSPSTPSGFTLTSAGWVKANGGQNTSSVTGSATYLKTATVTGGANGFQHPNTDSMGGTMRIQKGYKSFYVGFYNYYTRDQDDGGGPIPPINSSNPLTVEVWDCWGNKIKTLGTASYQVRGTTALTVDVSAYNSGLYFIKTYAEFWAWGYSWCSSQCYLEMKLS